jgi:peroxiredoxin
MKPHRYLLALCLLSLVAGACGLVTDPTLPPGSAATLAAQTWQAMQAEAGTAPAPEATGAPIAEATLPQVAGPGMARPLDGATPELPKASTATPRYPSRTPPPTEPLAPTLDIEGMVLTGIPTLLPLLTQALEGGLPGSDPIQRVEEAQDEELVVDPAVGALAPDFTLVDARSGERIQLSALQGRPVLINFWATWCTYCLDEMPVIQRAYEEHRDQELAVLAVDVQESRDLVRRFGDRMGLTFNLLLDSEGAVADEYRVVTMPTSYFVSRQGVIHALAVGAMDREALEQRLATILE